MIRILNQLFPDFALSNDLPNPLSTKINAKIKYNDILNYFSKLNSQ
jgi:hypothetical protein